MELLTQNSFPMRDWHIEHMEKTIVKYLKGISETASTWEKRQHRRYGTIANCIKQIEYDIKHGVTIDEVSGVLKKIKTDSSFETLRRTDGFYERFDEIERHFAPLKGTTRPLELALDKLP